MVVSGAGTTSDEHERYFYGPAASNYTADAEQRLIDGLREIAPEAEAAGVEYAIECHQLTTMRSAKVVRRVLDAVDSPNVVANFDPVNLLDSSYAAHTHAVRIPEMVAMVGHRYGPTTHVKDLRVTNDFVLSMVEVPPGEGLIDFGVVVAAAGAIPVSRTMAFIVEHLSADRAEHGIRFFRKAAEAAGVDFQM
jgi:sugar phosphate isomerase/epimerase